MRHLLDRDEPLSAIPSALLASIAFASYPDNTIALYVMWKMLQVRPCRACPINEDSFIASLLTFQITYDIGHTNGYLPKIPHFTFLLYCASTATLFHAATLEPTNLRASYWKFLHSLSGGRSVGLERFEIGQ